MTLPGRRVRAGCLAHVHRKFFDAQSTAPDAAKQAMDFVLEVYKIERAALDADLLGTAEHLEMRQTSSRAVMDDFKAWLDAEQSRHPPKGPMGEAINCRREPGRPRDLRGERREPRRLPRRRAHPRADPASRIDELLPHNWKPPRPEPST